MYISYIGPSFTSSPLSQRPLSPSATSDSGSESSTSTLAIDIPNARNGVRHGVNEHQLSPNRTTETRSAYARRSITALAFGEAIASSPSSDEEYDSFDVSPKPSLHNNHSPKRQSPLGLRGFGYTPSPPSHQGNLVASSSHSISPTSAMRQPRSTSLSQRRRSSGSFASPDHSFDTSRNAGDDYIGPFNNPPSPSLFSSSFVGSFEASILSGRMANKPSNATALPFSAQIGVLGIGKDIPSRLRCPDHLNIDFGAYFWDMDNRDRQGKGSPYVGTLDLEEHYISQLNEAAAEPSSLDVHNPEAVDVGKTAAPKFPGYRIPSKGQIQVVIKNANQTGVKLFLIPYDLSDMPPGTKTFLRQKSYDLPSAGQKHDSTPSEGSSSNLSARETLRYAIHLQFCAPPVKDKERGRKKGAPASQSGTSHSDQTHHHTYRTASHRGFEHSAVRNGGRRNSPHKPGQNSVPNPAPTASHIYLHKAIRIVFTSRALDLTEKLKVVLENPAGVVDLQSSASGLGSSAGPSNKGDTRSIYSPYSGPGEVWDTARKLQLAKAKAYERHTILEDPIPADPNAASLSSGDPLSSTSSELQRHAARRALLNTPPAALLFDSTSSRSPSSSDHHYRPSIADALTFERNESVGQNPLPSLIESGLAISRPPSRNEVLRYSATPAHGYLR